MTFKLFERKIGIKMIIDEGGVPSGDSLSGYIQARLEPARRPKEVTPTISRVSVLLEHLEELEPPLRELFVRFHGIELLEEVRTKYWGRSYSSYWGNNFIHETVPQSNTTKYGLELTSYYHSGKLEQDVLYRIPGGLTHSGSSHPDRPLSETPARTIKTGTRSWHIRTFRTIELIGQMDLEFKYSLHYRYLHERREIPVGTL